MDSRRIYLGLDVGEQRIGVAVGDSIGRIAQPVRTLDATGDIADDLKAAIHETDANELVVGNPRNQSGAETAQTEYARTFAQTVLEPLALPLHWQDESVTSVIAEDRLKARKKPYAKGDIDAEAASIILQDFLDRL